ncbi:MAG TPA: hypothetical protein VGJ92_11640 [Methanocella sp.]
MLMVQAVLSVLVVVFLRLLVVAKDSQGADIFRMFALIMLGLVAVCVYEFVRLSRTSTG